MQKKFFYTCLIALISLSLTGCTDKEYDEEAPINSNVKQIIEDQGYRPNENVPEPVLAEGQVLNIRLVYGIDEKDEDDDEWYMVELTRDGSRWHDMVKIQGLRRSAQRHWDDYTFSANNFNWQIEMEQYGTDTLDGVYFLTITSSNGYRQNYNLNWKNGRWTNIESARTFYVP